MPALLAFGRSWRIGSDDLVFPSFTEFVIRSGWVIMIAVLFSIYGASIGCSGSGYLSEVLISMIVVQGFVLLNLILIIVISMKGTMTEVHPRRHMNKFLYIRLALFIMEFFCYVIGSFAIFDPNLQCKNETVLWTMDLIIVFSWLIFLLLAVFIGLVFNPLGKTEDGNPKSLKIWERQIKVLCCCCFCGLNNDEQSQNAFQDIAELISKYIKGVDLVPSDVAAGLVLLASSGRRNVNAPISNQPKKEEPAKSWMTVYMANCYIKYAVASYGWPMYMYEHFCCGFCTLWPKLRCCQCNDPTKIIIDDNCCMCHSAAVKTITNNHDFIYVSFYNRVFETPFYIIADHETESIVVATRGTISQRDVLTDLSAECEVVDWIESTEPLCTHRGIHNAAQFIYKKIMELHILEEAFAKHPEYSLVITGHSLGAGTASILAFLLRPHYINLRCYAFSPPGCMFNEAFYKLSKDLIMSVVIGDDFIISLSWQSMEQFKFNLIDAIGQSFLPKYKILIGGCWRAACGSNQLTDSDDNSLDNTSVINTPLLVNQVNRGRSYSSEEQTVNVTEQPLFETLLYPPGLVLHIKGQEEGFTSSWYEPSPFRQLIVSHRMASDHMPNHVQNVLGQMVNSSSEQT